MRLWIPSPETLNADPERLTPSDRAALMIYSQLANPNKIELNPLDRHFYELKSRPAEHWQYFIGTDPYGVDWPKYTPPVMAIMYEPWSRFERMWEWCEKRDCEARPYKSLPQYEFVMARFVKHVSYELSRKPRTIASPWDDEDYL